MRKKRIVATILILMMSVLTGCTSGPDDFDETTITVRKRGSVSQSIVERFDRDYYDLGELTNEFNESVRGYNESIGSEEIKVKDIELKDSQIFVELDFTGPSDYESFTGETLFVGSVGDAYDNGYTMDVVLKGVSKGDKIDKKQIMEMEDKSIIILSEHARIKTFKDIAYVSANVDVMDSRVARVLSESDGLAYLILK